ncbi:hypothetical protein GLOIN_2v1734856 [Rhizophagus clarus]|uniref:Uncharacterized protein n=1 Tax=Rhizophagus clarus TaxID=94130 RepID=A0A8H3QCN0_9GLOM|nr:hypothetical protein GLOIN_2v1734856 [Rhizophagus clarus]
MNITSRGSSLTDTYPFNNPTNTSKNSLHPQRPVLYIRGDRYFTHPININVSCTYFRRYLGAICLSTLALNDNKTGEVYIIGMASAVHERIVTRLQEFFKVPNNGVVDDPPILVDGQILHYLPGGNGVEAAPDVCVSPNVAFVPKPAVSTVIPSPPGDTDGNSHARIMCEVAVGQDVSRLGQKCLSWMQEPYVRAVISIKILDPRLNMREPTTGYFYRTMTAKLYRQGMPTQRWDFGNIKKYSRDPINDPPGCNAPNLAAYQITIPISVIFWDPPSPIPPAYTPAIPPMANIIGKRMLRESLLVHEIPSEQSPRLLSSRALIADQYFLRQQLLAGEPRVAILLFE